MLKDIIAVQAEVPYRLRVRFEDGVEGEIDVAELIDFVGVFAPLRNWNEFSKVRVDSETGTIAWPNGADLDPLVIYARITGTPIAALLATGVEVPR